MVEARHATKDDAPELVRLQSVMLAALSGHAPQPGVWTELTALALRDRLTEPAGSLMAFVVDQPGPAGKLAACAVGVVENRLPGPHNLSGKVGYVFNVATDPEWRRRGYSRACMTALLGWYRHHGIVQIDLLASREGAPLYQDLGFALTDCPAMRLTLKAGPHHVR